MGKATGIFSNFTGKVANVVGYVSTNKQGKKQQMLRGYQPEVKNPKSIGQAVQRMKMKPIMNIYRALKSIIDRGFEGVKYGDMSRRKFMKLAMNDFVGPYLLKGDNRAVPSALIISSGSLPEITVDENDPDNLLTNLVVENGDFTTVSQLTAVLLAKNSFLNEGDQLTFVWIEKDGNNFIPIIKSVVLNSNDNSSIADLGASGVEVGDDYCLNVTYRMNGWHGAAVILSRQGEGGTMNLRSTCRLTVAMSHLGEFFTQDAFTAAALSYMSNGENITDWPEVEFDANIPAGTAIGALPTGSVTPASAVGTNALGYVTRGGQKGWYYKTTTAGKQALKADGSLLTVQVENITTAVVFADSFTNIYPASV